MAKFLTTSGNSYYIEQIVLNAEGSFTIVTPYLSLSQTLLDRLRDADKQGIKMSLIYGKDELNEKNKNSLKDLDNLEVFFCRNLHAKCYHNERLLVISSMNLYEFSEKNNREMGILIEKNVDNEIYNDTLKEISSIKNASLKQKSFPTKNEKSETSNSLIFELESEYNELWNFHLPAVCKILSRKYPQQSIILKDNIKIQNFPKKGIATEISGRIDFKFDNRYDFDQIKDLNKNMLSILLPKVRFYWNKPSLMVYLEPKFKEEITKVGIERKANRFVEILTTIIERINV